MAAEGSALGSDRPGLQSQPSHLPQSPGTPLPSPLKWGERWKAPHRVERILFLKKLLSLSEAPARGKAHSVINAAHW